MLRAVNVGGQGKIRMEALKALYESLGLRDVRTFIQSGNVVFRATQRQMPRLARRIEDAIEKSHGFRTGVILRTVAELREVVDRNPFASRPEINGGKLLVTFLMSDPGEDARCRVRAMQVSPEELHIDGREIYIYYPMGVGISKLPGGAIGRALGTPGTARNWNTVTKLLELASGLQAAD